MMSHVSVFSNLMNHNKLNVALQKATVFKTVACITVRNTADRFKLLETVLRIAKPKPTKILMVKYSSKEEKRIKTEMTHFRTFLCSIFREDELEGEMFALVVENTDRDKEFFALSNVKVGSAYLILKPEIIGSWAGLRMVSTCEPLLATNVIQKPYLFTIQGFIAFTIPNVGLKVKMTTIQYTCSGMMSGGRYGVT